MTGFQGPWDTRPLNASTVQSRANIADTEVRLFCESQTGEGTEREMRIDQIQQQVGKGEYQVDTRAVADAIVRRILGGGGRPTAGPTAGD
jgi:anti-sigma28 factor (negative regulator of flagellin synthesis)